MTTDSGQLLLNSAFDEDSEDQSAPLLKSALVSYALSLAADLAPVRERLDQIAELDDADEISTAVNQLKADLPDLLNSVIKKSTSDSTLEDSMSANFLNGVNKSDDSKTNPLTKPAAFTAVAASIKDDGTLPDEDVKKISEDFSDRADWSDANVKAKLLDDLSDSLDEILQRSEDATPISDLADELDFDPTGDDPDAIGDGLTGKSTVLMTILGIVGIAGGLGVYEASSEDPDCGGFYLFRAENRMVPRPWPDLWAEAGGTIYDPGDSGLEPDYPEGILACSPSDVGIFTDLSMWSIPVAPLLPNSGMDIAPISKDEASALGLQGDDEWQDVDLNAKVEFTAPKTEGIRNILLKNLGDDFEYDAEAGVIKLKSEPLTNSYTKAIRAIRSRNETADAIRNCHDYNDKQVEPAWKLMMPRKIKQPFHIANAKPIATSRRAFRVPGRKVLNDDSGAVTGSMSSLGSYSSSPMIKKFATRK